MNEKASPSILVVDDDKAVTASLALLLKQAHYKAVTASNPSEALTLLDNSTDSPFDLVFQDMNFSRQTSGDEGLELLKHIKQRHPQLPVILMTAWGSVELAVKGMKSGAADFVTKPWSHEQILHTVSSTLGLARANAAPVSRAKLSRGTLDREYDFSGLIGEDSSFLEVLDVIGRISSTDAPVLITGESGTGKELIAEAVWRNSTRANASFVKVNLGGIPGPLFESEMFGHVKGAFTGAASDRTGRFETAHRGTIFLDEIGDLELGSQVKMLRVLQDRTFEKLGSSRSRSVDVRVIAATNSNLKDDIETGQFREDLYYRLNLINVHLPPLRERRSDIPLLVNHFLDQLANHYKRSAMIFDDSALAWLAAQNWPGNVRQLKQTVERTVLLASGDVLTEDDVSRAASMEPERQVAGALPEPGVMSLEEIEKQMVEAALSKHRGHITQAAESLGISRNSLYRRMEKYGIEP